MVKRSALNWLYLILRIQQMAILIILFAVALGLIMFGLTLAYLSFAIGSWSGFISELSQLLNHISLNWASATKIDLISTIPSLALLLLMARAFGRAATIVTRTRDGQFTSIFEDRHLARLRKDLFGIFVLGSLLKVLAIPGLLGPGSSSDIDPKISAQVAEVMAQPLTKFCIAVFDLGAISFSSAMALLLVLIIYAIEQGYEQHQKLKTELSEVI